ncbi:3-oxoacyl-ACP reductase FabG [Shewanella intestini]|uniref:3-oxoacyl-ACP reductase FabG n=2 Tax=Shewanellaceae TaxID=267890 RepID=A0ABS5I2S6_9GAMM|nr:MULTISPECIES: 3-oxoacyl-ACP reductase FabG [Shewanella]MBR9728326.1 3-oxoacyl-ACP reductase FabG [Shewanella intestini]MRG35791.1 3-oxoacyl-ACP reductase FabG [Shewanella sp. XMDDZSB0408]
MKQVLVTGASKGIGKAIAIALGKAGFEVAVHYGHDKQGALDTLAQIESDSGKGRIVSFDIANREQCKAEIDQDITKHGAYFGVIINAGITRDTAFPSMIGEDWDQVIHTNLDGFYNVVHPTVMPMVGLREGRIVTISSLSGQVGNRGQVNYSASKAGLIGATKALAAELGNKRRAITVNCVAPGLIDTGMVEEHVKEHVLPAVPLKRMGKPEEVAGLVAFLLSPSAAYINRQVIGVNGGLHG